MYNIIRKKMFTNFDNFVELWRTHYKLHPEYIIIERAPAFGALCITSITAKIKNVPSKAIYHIICYNI